VTVTDAVAPAVGAVTQAIVRMTCPPGLRADWALVVQVAAPPVIATVGVAAAKIDPPLFFTASVAVLAVVGCTVAETMERLALLAPALTRL